MISNITNNLPSLLKSLKNKENTENLNFNLVETIKFFNSILPNDSGSDSLKHIFLDFRFVLKDQYSDLLKNFNLTVDSLDFLKDLTYELSQEKNEILIRGNCEDLAVLSLILLGSIKSLKNEVEIKNKSIFISLAISFLTFCLNQNYNVCTTSDIKILEEYNKGFNKELFKSISVCPTSENDVGTLHFIGIEFNKDILCIFEKYKNVKFTFNYENASFLISMTGKDWDNFWENSPRYLKDEFVKIEKKIDIR